METTRPLFAAKSYFKIIHGSRVHDDIIYPSPLNMVHLKSTFNDNPADSCCAGGLYITNGENIHRYLMRGDIILWVELPIDNPLFRIVKDSSEPLKYRVNMFQILDEWSLHKLSTYVTFYEHGIDLLKDWLYSILGLIYLSYDNPTILKLFLKFYGKRIKERHKLYFLHLIYLQCVKNNFNQTKKWIKQKFSNVMYCIAPNRSLVEKRPKFVKEKWILKYNLDQAKNQGKLFMFTYLLHLDIFSMVQLLTDHAHTHHKEIWQLCILVTYRTFSDTLDKINGMTKAYLNICLSQIIWRKFWRKFFKYFPNVVIPTIKYLLLLGCDRILAHFMKLRVISSEIINEVRLQMM